MGLSTYTTLDGQHTLPRGPRTTAKFVSRHTSLFVTLVSTLVLTYCSNTIRVVLCRLEWPPLRPWRWCRRWSWWAWWCWLFFGLLRLQQRPKSHIDGVPLSSTPFFDRLAYLHSISQSSATFWVAIGGEFFLDDLGIVFETYHGFGIWLYSAEILHVSANISIACDLY